MTYYSAVLIVPAALIDKANALGAAMGHGPQSYSVPLSTGEGVTHYGARARGLPAFSAMLAAAGRIPQEDWGAHGIDADQVVAGGVAVAGLDLEAHGLTEVGMATVVAALIFDIRPEVGVIPAQHFAEVCNANSLVLA